MYILLCVNKNYYYYTSDVCDTMICASVEANSRQSSKQIVETVGTSSSTVRKILKKNKYHSYKIQKFNKIFPENCFQRMQFCETVMEKCNNNDNFLQNIIFTDESSFPLHGNHNPQIVRYWSRERQHLTYNARTQYPQKLNVWTGFLNNHIAGPFFINGNLNSHKYLNLFQDDIVPAIDRLPDININNVWFQQDACPAHNAVPVKAYLSRIFPDRLICAGGNIHWPARSPDLSPNHFYLWGYVKQSIYITQEERAANLEELQQRIVNCMHEILPQTLAKARVHFYDSYCLMEGGERFEHLLK